MTAVPTAKAIPPTVAPTSTAASTGSNWPGNARCSASVSCRCPDRKWCPDRKRCSRRARAAGEGAMSRARVDNSCGAVAPHAFEIIFLAARMRTSVGVSAGPRLLISLMPISTRAWASPSSTSSLVGKCRKNVRVETSAASAISATVVRSNPCSSKSRIAAATSASRVRRLLRSRRPSTSVTRTWPEACRRSQPVVRPASVRRRWVAGPLVRTRSVGRVVDGG